MQVYIGLASFIESHLLLIPLLQLVHAQITPPLEEDSPRVIRFVDLWGKCICQPMEQLVDLEQEFPGEVEHIYIPSCVPLKRCSGFCGDESLECHPTLKRNITVEMKRITVNVSSNQVELTFVEHERCECRARQNLQKQKSSGVSTKTKPQKKNRKTANGSAKCRYSKKKINRH